MWNLDFNIKLKAVGKQFDQISHNVKSIDYILTRFPVIISGFRQQT